MKRCDLAGRPGASHEKKNIKEIIALRKKILRYNKAYYQDTDPLVSDFEYDQTVKRLENLEDMYPDLASGDSPIKTVGEKPLLPFETIPHLSPMLSLDNTYSRSDVLEFYNRVKKTLEKDNLDYLLELKIDGAAVSLRYENRRFIKGLTRGDGKEGDDITRNILRITGIPLELPDEFSDKRIEIRGELYLSKKNFEKINNERKRLEKPLFANPRNASAGSMKLLDPDEFSKRNLEIMIHSTGDEPVIATDKHSDILKHLEKAGFQLIPERTILHDVNDIFEWAARMEKKRKTLEYDIDGIVIKVDELRYRKQLGATLKSPRWAVAYKLSADRVRTTVKDIVVQVGRTGTLTPVAELDPIPLAGTIVKRATLHNADEIERLDIRIGDTVFIEKGGDIIPKVIGVDILSRKKNQKVFVFPARCPACNAKIMIDQGEIRRFCPDPRCPEQLERRIEYFASRKVMDIESLGPSIIKKLIDVARVRCPADIYYLKDNDDVLIRLLKIDGFGVKMLENLLVSIENSKTKPIGNVIAGLGIPGIGEKMSRYLADRYHSIDNITKLTVDELETIPGIGKTLANNIVEFFELKSVSELIERLSSAGVRMDMGAPNNSNVNQIFKHKKVVITGTLPNWTRNKAEEMIRIHGGDVSSTVSRKTDYIVVGDSPGSKSDKAKELGIEIIPAEAFEKMFKDDVINVTVNKTVDINIFRDNINKKLKAFEKEMKNDKP